MEEGSDLPPGLQPAWSSDGESLAFRSCLEINNGKSWKPTPNGPPEIYVMDLNTDTLVAIAPGEMPQWRP